MVNLTRFRNLTGLGKGKWYRFWGVSYLGLFFALLLASGCGGPGPKAAAADPLAGRYTAHGGSSPLALVTALTERFSKLHPGVVWLMEDVGSDASISLAAQGNIDIGFISRDLKTGEQGNVALLPLAGVGTVVAVNAKNPVTGLTKAQVKKIFTGEITDWSEVGGTPGKIRVLVRKPTSSTRVTFEKCFLGDKAAYPKDAIEADELPEMISGIQSFKDTIGMVTLDNRTVNHPDLRLLAIDGAAATRENIDSGAYKCRRPLYLVYHPDPNKLKPAIRAFLEFVRGAEGQRVISNFELP